MGFLLLLVVMFVLSVGTAVIVLAFFRKPIDKILQRIIGEDVAVSWRKFLTFALFVVAVSSGVRVWKLEQYIA
ncbi:hypothetical protein GF377_00665, partial [candidate division GN15 bacterium]|nr:hypothetical protein [candidate division GN15 bacterium]